MITIINVIGFIFLGILIGILGCFAYLYKKDIKIKKEHNFEILKAKSLLESIGNKIFLYSVSVSVPNDEVSKAIALLISSGYVILGEDGKVVTNIVQISPQRGIKIVVDNSKVD